MKPTLLILEDDRLLAETLRSHLQKKFEITTTDSVEGACRLLEKSDFNLLLADRVVIDGDGTEVIEFCREIRPQTKIISCSQLTSVQEKLFGLTAGADDYLYKPFSLTELSIKLQNFSKLNRDSQAEIITVGLISLNITTGELQLADKQKVQLRKKEAQILHTMLKKSPRTLSRDEIIDAIWTDVEKTPTYTTLDVYIRRLRMALGKQSGCLKTIRGFGYQICQG